MDTKTRIRCYFDKAIAAEITDDDDIFALGVVDSLFAIQLVVFVENEFSLEVAPQELDIDNFCSVSALTRFVIGKVGGSPDVRPPA
jgi:acyl carrier protein